MPIQVQCPHCRGVCQVGEQHMGAMVNCGRCSKPFMVGGAPARPAAPTQPAGMAPRPVAAPPGTYESAAQPSLKDTVRDVFKSIMPFSKIDAPGPILIRPSAGSPPPQPVRPPASNSVPDDDVGFDFVPAAEAALRTPAQRSPGITIQVPAGAKWSAPTSTGVCRLDAGGATSVGMIRKRNEDSFLIQHPNWANLDQRTELVVAQCAAVFSPNFLPTSLISTCVCSMCPMSKVRSPCFGVDRSMIQTNSSVA